MSQRLLVIPMHHVEIGMYNILLETATALGKGK